MKPKELLGVLKHGANTSRIDKSVFWVDPPCQGGDVPLKGHLGRSSVGGKSTPTPVYPRDILDLCDYVSTLEANARQTL